MNGKVSIAAGADCGRIDAPQKWVADWTNAHDRMNLKFALLQDHEENTKLGCRCWKLADLMIRVSRERSVSIPRVQLINEDALPN